MTLASKINPHIHKDKIKYLLYSYARCNFTISSPNLLSSSNVAQFRVSCDVEKVVFRADIFWDEAEKIESKSNVPDFA